LSGAKFEGEKNSSEFFELLKVTGLETGEEHFIVLRNPKN
jgi:hypothetical protein